MTMTAPKMKKIAIWDAELIAVESASANWNELKQQMNEPVQITDEMFAEACTILSESESDYLKDNDGQFYAVGMVGDAHALYRVPPPLRFVELAQFNAENKYCSHRLLALRADENLECELKKYERYIRDISFEKWAGDTWYSQRTALAEEVLIRSGAIKN